VDGLRCRPGTVTGGSDAGSVDTTPGCHHEQEHIAGTGLPLICRGRPAAGYDFLLAASGSKGLLDRVARDMRAPICFALRGNASAETRLSGAGRPVRRAVRLSQESVRIPAPTSTRSTPGDVLEIRVAFPADPPRRQFPGLHAPGNLPWRHRGDPAARLLVSAQSARPSGQRGPGPRLRHLLSRPIRACSSLP